MTVSTVHGIEQQIRYPIIGQLKIGEKVATQDGHGERPNQLDHFKLVPKEGYDYLKGCFYEAYGPEPKSLSVLLPWDTIQGIMPHSYQSWRKAGLWCEGDNQQATRYDLRGESDPVQLDCSESCPVRQGGDCKLTGWLRVLLPDMPALAGAYLIKASPSSVSALLGCLHAIKGMRGRLSGVEMILSLVPFKGATGATNYRLHLDLAQGQPTLRQVLAQGPGSAPLLIPGNETEPEPPLLGEEGDAFNAAVESPAESQPEDVDMLQGLIDEVTAREKQVVFNSPEHRANARKKHAGNSGLYECPAEGLTAYLTYLHGKLNEQSKPEPEPKADPDDLDAEIEELIEKFAEEEQPDLQKTLSTIDAGSKIGFKKHLENRLKNLEVAAVPLN